jgi:hypothetical protein
VVERKFGAPLADRAELGAPLAVLAVEHEELLGFVEPEHIAKIVHVVWVELDLAPAFKRRLDEQALELMGHDG